MIADTGAILALVDRSDRHHARVRDAFQANPADWLLPWAILPELDYLLSNRMGRQVARTFLGDVRAGLFVVEWHGADDIERALQIDAAYADLELGLVDCIVMAQAERLGARAIATLDTRHFGAVELTGRPELWPRDLS